MVQNVADQSVILRQLAKEGHTITPDILSIFSPYLNKHVKRFGQYFIDFDIPAEQLDMESLGIPVPQSP
jgi:hypothetical protein